MWSEWTAIKSDGTIPDSLLPCDTWQARWFLNWEYDILDPSTNSAQVTGEWHWSILEGTREVFYSKNKVRVQLYWQSFTGEISAYGWYHDSGYDRVLTTVPEWANRPLTPEGEMIWAGGEVEYVGSNWSASHPAALGVEQPYLDPASGESISDYTAYIDPWWQGAVYEIPLGVGAKWKVSFHNVGATRLAKSLNNLQIKTKRGGDVGGCYDAPGVLRCGGMEGSNAVQRILPQGNNSSTNRFISNEFRSPQLLKDSSNKLYCFGEKASIWKLRISTNDGYTWEEVGDMWPAGYKNARFVILPDGSVVSVATNGSSLFSTRVGSGTPNYVTNEAVPPLSIQYDARTGITVTDTQGNTWVSADGGVVWERVI